MLKLGGDCYFVVDETKAQRKMVTCFKSSTEFVTESPGAQLSYLLLKGSFSFPMKYTSD